MKKILVLFTLLTLTTSTIFAATLTVGNDVDDDKIRNLEINEASVYGRNTSDSTTRQSAITHSLEIVGQSLDKKIAARCRVTKEVAEQAGYTLGDLQMALLGTTPHLNIFCSIKDRQRSLDADRIVIIGRITK